MNFGNADKHIQHVPGETSVTLEARRWAGIYGPQRSRSASNGTRLLDLLYCLIIHIRYDLVTNRGLSPWCLLLADPE